MGMTEITRIRDLCLVLAGALTRGRDQEESGEKTRGTIKEFTLYSEEPEGYGILSGILNK